MLAPTRSPAYGGSMPMLSDAGRKRRPQRAAPLKMPPPRAHAAPEATSSIEFDLAGVPVQALAEGGLYIADSRVLVVSDLHLEKGSSFALYGQMIPPYDTRA